MMQLSGLVNYASSRAYRGGLVSSSFETDAT